MMVFRLIMIVLIGVSDIAVAQTPFDQILRSPNEKWDAYLLKPGLGFA